MTDSKIHILTCALKLFLEKGYDAATMMDLVRATGLSKGAFYHYFKTKEELYQATIEHYFLRFFQTEASVPADLDAFVDMLWQSYVNMLLELQKELPDLSAYYRFLFAVLPRIRSELLVYHQEVRVALIEKLTEQSKPTAVSPEQVADHILALIEGTGMLAVVRGTAGLKEQFKTSLHSYLTLLRQK